MKGLNPLICYFQNSNINQQIWGWVIVGKKLKTEFPNGLNEGLNISALSR